MFKLDNTDQIWWKTLPDMEKQQKAKKSTHGMGPKSKSDDLLFDVKSGMGKGVYAINTNKGELSFQIKIVRSGS